MRVRAGVVGRWGGFRLALKAVHNDIAEEAAAEAFAAAVGRWPAGGVPPNPGAWLITTASRKARSS
jgi:predicted RNA polymerase sigma factor